MKQHLAASELLLNPDGSLYHVCLFPEELANTVITVGDPDRVPLVSRYFDKISVKKQNREIVAHTGSLQGKDLTVISTGMGTDNVDIVLNELDALVNIDLVTRQVKPNLKSLNIIRLGTSGALQSDIPIDSTIITSHAFGFDSLLRFYVYHLSEFEQNLQNAAHQHFAPSKVYPYIVSGDTKLVEHFYELGQLGVTATCCGFYGPQGRILRGDLEHPNLMSRIENFKYNQLRVTNFEMETAGIYGLGKILGHRCCSLNSVILNRINKTFVKDVDKTVDNLIKASLEKIISLE